MIKSALIESKKLLDFYIENIENIEDLSEEQLESVKHFIKALKCGCECDDYNGYNCGCNKRACLYDEAFIEIAETY